MTARSLPLNHSLSGSRDGRRLALRGRVRLRRRALDRMLAAGARPAATAELACRAQQLSSSRVRAGIALGFERVVEAADEPARGRTAAAPLNRSEIRAARGRLLELAGDLRSDDPVSPRGVALAERLLTDGLSPIYAPAAEGALLDAVRHARAALLLA